MIAHLWLDYQRADPERRRPGMILLAVGGVAAALTSVDYLAVAAERDDAQAQVEGLRGAAEQRSAAQAKTPAPAAARETRAIGPSAAHWDALFAALEAASDDSVTLLTLHPGEKEIQLSGEAKDFPSAVDYVQRLQSQPAVANVRMTQSETVAENPRHPVRFALAADWRSAR